MMSEAEQQKYFLIGIALLFVFGLIIITAINVAFNKTKNAIDYARSQADEAMEGIYCDITYKDIHYKGICTEEVINSFRYLVEFDMRVNLAKLCADTTGSYNYQVCRDIQKMQIS